MVDIQDVVRWTFYMSPDNVLNSELDKEWITGNSWDIAPPPLSLDNIGNNIGRKVLPVVKKIIEETISDNVSILDKMDPKRREKLSNRDKATKKTDDNTSWITLALPPWVSHPLGLQAKWLPVRISLKETQHSFLRSIAWNMDIAIRYQGEQFWTISRIEWLKQIATDLEKSYTHLYGDMSIISLQQSVMRSNVDWDEYVKSSLSDGVISPVLQLLLDWCQVQCWIWKEETQTIHKYYGRAYSHSQEHQEALPVIVIWWDGNKFEPVVWLEGMPSSPNSQSLRPLPRAWLSDWEKLWFIERGNETDSDTELVLEDTKIDDSEEEDLESEPEPKSEPVKTTESMKITIPAGLKKGSKPYWQHILTQLGVDTKKRSEKTGKMIDKTINEMEVEAENIGWN